MSEELKRVFLRPLFYALLLGCVAVNLWVLWNASGQRSLVIASRETAKQLNTDTDSALLRLQSGQTAAIAQSIVQRLPDAADGGGALGSGETPTVLQMLDGALAMANGLTSEDMAGTYIAGEGLKDKAADIARKIFSQLEPVMEENRENGTASTFFVPCNEGFFQLFTHNLLLFLMVESIVCSVLLMMNTANDAFSAKLAGLVYSSRRGRRLHLVKLLAGLLTAVLFTAALWAVTMGLTALIFPMGSLWQVPLGSMMVLDQFYPLISRFPMTVGQYVFVQFPVALGCVCLFALGAYGLVTRLHNSFSGCMLLGLVSALIYTVTFYFPKTTFMYFVMQCNPIDLARKAGRWLVSGAAGLSPQFYEVFTLAVWLVILGLAGAMETQRFYQEDLI